MPETNSTFEVITSEKILSMIGGAMNKAELVSAVHDAQALAPAPKYPGN